MDNEIMKEVVARMTLTDKQKEHYRVYEDLLKEEFSKNTNKTSDDLEVDYIESEEIDNLSDNATFDRGFISNLNKILLDLLKEHEGDGELEISIRDVTIRKYRSPTEEEWEDLCMRRALASLEYKVRLAEDRVRHGGILSSDAEGHIELRGGEYHMKKIPRPQMYELMVDGKLFRRVNDNVYELVEGEE